MSTCGLCISPKLASYRLTRPNNCILNNDLGDYKFWDRRRPRKPTQVLCRCKRKHCPTLQFCARKQEDSLPGPKPTPPDEIKSIFNVKKIPNIPFTEYRCDDLFNVYGSVAENWIDQYFKSQLCEKKTKKNVDSNSWLDAHSKFYKEKVSPPSLTLVATRRKHRDVSISISKQSFHRRLSRRHPHRKSHRKSQIRHLGSMIVTTPLGYYMPFQADNIYTWNKPRKESTIIVRPDGNVEFEKETEYNVIVAENVMVKHLKNKFMEQLRTSIFNIPGAVKRLNLSNTNSAVRFTDSKIH